MTLPTTCPPYFPHGNYYIETFLQNDYFTPQINGFLIIDIKKVSFSQTYLDEKIIPFLPGYIHVIYLNSISIVGIN